MRSKQLADGEPNTEHPDWLPDIASYSSANTESDPLANHVGAYGRANSISVNGNPDSLANVFTDGQSYAVPD